MVSRMQILDCMLEFLGYRLTQSLCLLKPV